MFSHIITKLKKCNYYYYGMMKNIFKKKEKFEFHPMILCQGCNGTDTTYLRSGLGGLALSGSTIYTNRGIPRLCVDCGVITLFRPSKDYGEQLGITYDW